MNTRPALGGWIRLRSRLIAESSRSRAERHRWRNFREDFRGKFVARMSPAPGGGESARGLRRGSTSRAAATTESQVARRLVVPSSVTIGRSIVETFPEEALRRRVIPNSLLRNPTAYLTRITAGWNEPGLTSRESQAKSRRGNVALPRPGVRRDSGPTAASAVLEPERPKLSDDLVRSVIQWRHNNGSRAHSRTGGTRKRTKGAPREADASGSNATTLEKTASSSAKTDFASNSFRSGGNARLRKKVGRMGDAKDALRTRSRETHEGRKRPNSSSGSDGNGKGNFGGNLSATRSVDDVTRRVFEVSPASSRGIAPTYASSATAAEPRAVGRNSGTSRSDETEEKPRRKYAREKHNGRYGWRKATTATTELALDPQTSSTKERVTSKKMNSPSKSRLKAGGGSARAAATINSDAPSFRSKQRLSSPRKTYETTDESDESDGKRNFHKTRKDNELWSYHEKYLRGRVAAFETATVATASQDERDRESPDERTVATAKVRKDDYRSINTESLLYESNSPNVEMRRYLLVERAPEITNDIDDETSPTGPPISSEVPTNPRRSETSRGAEETGAALGKLDEIVGATRGDDDDDEIDSGLLDSDETTESMTDSRHTTPSELRESRETLEEESTPDFGVLFNYTGRPSPPTTTTTGIPLTRASKGEEEEPTTERHNKRRHKDRHNDRENNRFNKRNRSRNNGRRKNKRTTVAPAEAGGPTTNVDYGRDKETTSSHNDPSQVGIDSSTTDRSENRNPADAITTEDLGTRLSGVDEPEHFTTAVTDGPRASGEIITSAARTTTSDVPPSGSPTTSGDRECPKKQVTTTTERGFWIWLSSADPSENCTRDTSSSPATDAPEEDRPRTAGHRDGSATDGGDSSASSGEVTEEPIGASEGTSRTDRTRDERGSATDEPIRDRDAVRGESRERSQGGDASTRPTTDVDVAHHAIANLDSEEEDDDDDDEEEEDDDDEDDATQASSIFNGAANAVSFVTEDYEADNCDEDQHACDKYTCVEEDKLCDGIVDCLNANDEIDCDYIYIKRWEEHLRVNGGLGAVHGPQQLPPPRQTSTDDTSTEGCGRYEHPCDGGCVNALDVCDGQRDCADGSDEEHCENLSVEECPEDQLPCDNGVCISKSFFCDRNIDCHDGSDERDCPDVDESGGGGGDGTRRCPHDSFTCNDGSCIPQAAVCDGRADCPHDEDETNCRRGCTRDQFQCANGDCINADQRCNGYVECADGSDEPEECEPPVTGYCATGQFMCISDRRCVPHSSICNGIPECKDGSDERNCGSTDGASELRLKTYPSEQVIKESREVVFQCRDEGLLRARVRWIRANGLPLPPGSRDINGRLEIPNIQLDHAGTYICEAVGYAPSTPGSQVNVILEVEKFELPVTRPPLACQYDESTCSNGDCIPKSYVCDGKFDCTDGSDEMRCSPHGCEPNEFRCNNKQCVSKLWRCDGDKDCADGSDEESCAPSPPGSACRYNEFACSSNKQCIPKSYHCDMERDCLDGSDELGCSPVYIVKPPLPMVVLEPGDMLILTCTAIGVPIPEINWRLNWGHIPSKCTTTSVNGTGTLTCPDIQPENQGAYSCEALNVAGFVFAVPDAIVVVKEPGNICPRGKFNSEAKSPEECISCFCFGVAAECRSADLFTYHIPPPFDRHKIVSVETAPSIKIHGDISNQISQIRPLGRDGVQLLESFSNDLNTYNTPYFALPENYHGSQLKSYGGYLKYSIRHSGNGTPNTAPNVIVTGNNYVLVHKGREPAADYDTEVSVRFFYGEWYKQEGRSEILASREEIMMTLANVDNILIKVKYDDSPQLDVRLTNIIMDTADVRNTGLGSASFVEECQCPSGYTGLSCEHCAPGYLRRENGPWLGQCYRDEPPCPPGYYGDPLRNIPCQTCPCPLTNPSNQFARTCHLGFDGQPTCDCPAGYVGRRCEQCAAGYQGNPLIPGDMCVPVQQCDPDGSLSPNADPHTGKCHCKEYATGLTCNQCKANTFNLASTNQFGCIACFCMGITNRCISSNWYRNEIRVSFTNSIRDFSLIESKNTDAPAIIDGIRLDTISREIIYSDFPNRGNNDVYYWQLPSIFLGDQITSYGGDLKYTVRYVPSPGGQSSRNNAADVELISANDINLLYYSHESPEPNSQQSFTVPLLEQYWQRNDGTQADREHLLMALADVRTIRIKATYTTHTGEAALSFVSLDTAEKYNTGKERAVEVEECTCPAGYRGLSCEDCDVGYTRAIEGLYLGICESCNCNGHSNQCDPETGICENCAHHTTGDSCEICEPGYEGDATRGSPNDCSSKTHEPTCRCNEAGSLSTLCVDDRCECKRNVEGPKCNRCRPSTYGLRAENIDGCIECYCSGVTDQCHESTLYIQQIPMWVYDSHHGFTLTDSTRREVIADGFELNVAMNEIGYRYPDSRSRRLFWSLPSVFTGNKVKSYGGNLTLTQHITAHPDARSYKDQDILLIGNGITLFWTNPTDIQPDIPMNYSVPLKESEWKRLTIEGPRSVSRTDLMIVLSNLEAILVRASHSERMSATYISDISMDTAVENLTGNRRATQVEACRCPTGYLGSSCETCARGYYRDTNDRSVSYLGRCSPCPCNKNEESCEISRSGQIKCHCLPGYTGQYCQDVVGETSTTTQSPMPHPPRIIVYVQEPEFQIVHTGNTVRYHCSGRSQDSDLVRIRWEKEDGQLPPGRSVDDANGLLVIRDVKVSDSGIYVCQVSDGINIAIKKVTLTVGGANPVGPRTVITPHYQQVEEGRPVEFRCEATGNPPPQLDWVRVHGTMSPEATFYNGVWSLPAASKSDAAEYKCIARNSVGVDERTTYLYVQDNPNKPPYQVLPPTVTPSEWSGTSGDAVRLICTPSQRANVTWTRSGGLPLPNYASQRDGVLSIASPSPSDSGIYVCTSTDVRGTETSTTAKIVIVPRRDPPTIKVKPERQVVSQGTVAEVRCVTSGEPGIQVKWTKYTETMSSRVQQVGDTLRIVNAQVSDRGVYICRVSSTAGSYEASAIVEVAPREAPVVELYPQDTQTVILGGSADLQCRAKAGFPVPELHWSRQDGRSFASNIEQLPGGLLRLSNITTYDGGAYICSASNEVGSTSIVAHIEVQSMPVITITPKHGILQVKRGGRVRLMCSASGHPQPNVAWSKHVNGMTVYDTYSRTAATPLSAVYEIVSVSLNDEGSYTCQATNAVGIAEERIQIRIEDDNDVDNLPCTGDRGDIPCSPDDERTSDRRDPNQQGVLIPEDYLRIPNGGKVEMRCQVFGPDGAHIYLDWERSDHRSLPEGSTVHNGVLSIPTVDRSAAGEYICLGLDPAGTVLFRAKSHLEIISPPRIELNPTRQTVGPGENPSIVCSATGDEPLHIEWEAIGRPLPYSVTHQNGVLQFHGITYSDAGKYVCKATNGAGTAEAVAEVSVNEHSYDDTRIRAEHRDMTTYAGSSVRLRCEVRERATIHWSREGQALPITARIGDDYLELIQVKPEDSGRYICQAHTSRGVSSDYINFNVSPAASPLVSIEVSQDPVNIGDTVDIHCTCSGIRNPRYHWSRPNHIRLPANAQIYDNVLRLTNVAVDDSGPYRCIVNTSEGTFEKDLNLIVHGGHNDEPAIETKFAPYGSSLEMDCRIDLDPPIQFQWNKLGGLLPSDTQTLENKLKLTNVKAEDAGTYICVANNGHMNIEVPTVLVVTGVVPNFSQAPESYIALPPLPDSYLKFNIEISFKPESNEGILLYNDESGNDNGDFIVLSLINGYPQFKFNLGSGPAVVRADKPVTLSEWHTIKIQRNRKEGTMLVDGEGPYKVIAVGRRQGLDLKEPLYVGGIPRYNRVNAEIENNSGFVGCISRLVLGEKQVDLIGDQTDSVGITNCETCAENPCNNGGVCQEASTKNGYMCLCRAGFSGKHCDFVGQSCYPGACGEGKCVDKEIGFDCYCPLGKNGPRCQRSVNVYEPAFHDERAFLAHDTPKALRRERESSTTTHSRSRLRNAQVRKPRSRPHHHNNSHHTKH